MSQVNSYDREQYATDGVTKTFSFGWDVNSTDDVKVNFVRDDGTILNVGTFIDSNDDEYTTSNFSFVVELNRQGGTITFADTPADNQNIIIWRETELVYENSFKTATAFPAAAIDKAYRKIWLALQEVQSDVVHNTVRMTPNQRGLHFGEFSEDVTGCLVYYNNSNTELLFTPFTISDVQNTIALAQNIPSIAGNATEALSRATTALTVANNTKNTVDTHISNLNNPHQTSIINLKDTDINSPVYGQSLVFDGTKWKNKSSTAVVVWGDVTGDINNQTDLKNALDSKQDIIADLTTIRSDATAGKSASETIATYGDIVTHNVSEFATASQGTKADTAVQPSDLATVATTGSYNDLLNKPTIPSAQIQSDWTQADSSAVDYIKNKPTLGTAAAANTTDFATAAQGSLADTAVQPSDLTNYVTTNTTQTITGEKVFSGIMNYSAGKTYILAGNGGQKLGYWSYDVDGGSNITLQTMTASTRDINFKTNNGGKVKYNGSEIAKVSSIPTAVSQLSNDSGFITNAVNDLVNYTPTSSLATVAISGDYDDLINKPTIPAAQVNSDWNANSGVAQILNKPTIPTVNDATITITQGGVTKGSFTLNQASGDTISLDAGGSSAIDEIIDYQLPSAGNNYTWYRKYQSGWVEQGGEATFTANGNSITLPVAMADTHYVVQLTTLQNTNTFSRCYVRDTTYIAVATSGGDVTGGWIVSGTAASS